MPKSNTQKKIETSIANDLVIEGICENNLKNLDLKIEHNTINVITGPSGSGKTSLAFDTIYAEGGRRYIETFSPYTRQFLDRLHQPNIKSCSGVRPTLALEQRNRITTSRSTVGTLTEINDYLKITWANHSTLFCPKCNIEVKRNDAGSIAKEIKETNCIIYFSLKQIVNAKSILETLSFSGFSRTLNEKTGEVSSFEKHQEGCNEINIVVDRLSVSASFQRVIGSVSQALTFGHGEFKVYFTDNKDNKTFAEGFKCTCCFTKYANPKPSAFSFNSAIGACSTCTGFGSILALDPKLIVPDPSLSLEQGAISCWQSDNTKNLLSNMLTQCRTYEIPTNIAWQKLNKKQQDLILYGEKKFKSVNTWFTRLQSKRHKMHIRVLLSRFRSEFTCPDCLGTRIKSEALNYKIDQLSISDFCKLSITDCIRFLENKEFSNSPTGQQVISRLRYLDEIGLGYLNLDRTSKTLSGGESQRVGLTSILGADLSDTTIVLDEPTIGLHAQDTHRLIESFEKLREKSNTLVIVEHDLDVIKSADRLIDIGPGSGSKGGEIVFSGAASDKTGQSLTLKALNAKLEFKDSKLKPKTFINVKNANKNNLKNLNVKIPLNCLCTIVGVSGSGKSSLVKNLLEQHPERKDIILVDQSAIGKTPRSNAATYTKAWDYIRELLAETEDAVRLGLSKSSFSFNVDAGRCIACSGAGYTKVEMQFLSDVYVECEQCAGTRFQDLVRTVKFRGKNVNDFLNMTLEESANFCSELEDNKAKSFINCIKPLIDLGLGYLTLGQPLSSVSGGEAQRIKLASYMNQVGNNIFILDEPTTGLHNNDISVLIKALEKLIDNGNSIICVEHNLHLIANSDWLIEIGPVGGKDGGFLIAEGSVKDLLKKSTPTINALNFKAEIKQKPKKHIASSTSIEILGARQNNLRNINVSIPKNKINVITGVSGSGKSTLAFEILFAEGQRRYIDCLSPYARQYIKQLSRPDVDRVSNISPTIAVSQKTSPPLGVSTIATISEIYQYLRLLYSKLGQQLCPDHLVPVSSLTLDSLIETLTEKYQGKRIFLLAPAVQGRKGIYNDLFQRALSAEISQAKIDGKIVNLNSELRLDRAKLHWISLVIASISINKSNLDLLKPALEQCLVFGNGSIELSVGDLNSKSEILSVNRTCPKCERGFLPLDPQDFSFRSNRGVCRNCEGTGVDAKNKQCNECSGSRISEIGRNVIINNKRIHELHRMKPAELKEFLTKTKFSKNLSAVFNPLLKEILARLEMIEKIGLNYLNLDREANTLSGGEAQRLRLAKAIGSPLTGACYVLDEPSIGLHSADQETVLNTLQELKAQGNTLVVVEHDEDTILSADNIFDFGPGGGELGGHIIAQGSPQEIIQNPESLTGLALKRKPKELSNQKISGPYLEISKANVNNLKNLNLKIPLNKLTVVAGVSGAGKSSLVHQTLVKNLISDLENETNLVKGSEKINRYIEVDQTPIGKTSTSTPISYLGMFDEIRKVFAATNDAKAQGWKAGYFSFNTGDGRCKNCEGKGYNKTEMSFLPDAVTLCEVCNGKRYSEQAQEIRYQDLSIADVLNLTFAQASAFFINHRKIKRTIDCVLELGIGYLRLGQPSHTLSGGEAQRIKIANELGMRLASETLYVLDEPTVGLHMNDVDKLINVLKGLSANNNTVIVVEHNLDVIRSADYLIELGPKAGEEGGNLLFSGTPYELKNSKLKTPTKTYL